VAGKKLLVADDSLTIQKVIRLALSNEGYEIQAISDGADALQQISVFRPDLVLIDVSLPTRSAFEIKRELNTMEEFENTRFILMSSAFEKIDEIQASEVQFHGRLTKPFDPAHLRQVLQDVLKTTSAPSPKKTDTKPGFSIQLDKTENAIHLDPPPSYSPEPPTQVKMEEMGEFTPSPLPELTMPQLPSPGGNINLSFEEPEAPDTIDIEEKTDPRGGSSGNQKDEIKHLTESTIRMSGLDDFDWTVNDSNIKPPVSMDDGGSGFRVKPQFSSEPPAPQGMPPITQTQQPRTGNTGSFNKPTHNPPPLPSASNGGISTEQLEETIRRQVEQTLSEMARKILPEVAERVIKAEIHRLLNEKM
jgi:two-component system cell cycle response regulator